MKVKIKTKLVVDHSVYDNEMIGMLHDEKLQFLEKDTKVLLDFKKQSMIREDVEKKLLYKFRENEETLNELRFYQENLNVQIPIVTNCFRVNDGTCKILYYLVDAEREVCYTICWEELQ